MVGYGCQSVGRHVDVISSLVFWLRVSAVVKEVGGVYLLLWSPLWLSLVYPLYYGKAWSQYVLPSYTHKLYQPLTCKCKRGMDEKTCLLLRVIYCQYANDMHVNALLHWLLLRTSAARHRVVTYLMCTVVACSQIPFVFWKICKPFLRAGTFCAMCQCQVFS